MGSVRDECLNLHVCTSLVEAQVRLNRFRQEHNIVRPHSQLRYLSPHAFKVAWAQVQAQDP